MILTKGGCMHRVRAGMLVMCVVGLTVVGQARPGQDRSNMAELRYKLVAWPTPPTSAAGVPAGPWNFIQVASVAVSARGTILVLHRGAHPIMEFAADGAFIRSWGDGLFSEGK